MSSKYLSIYNEVLSGIEAQKYQTGAILPSEKELMESFQVSRDTVRKALNLLEEGGYIHKIKGKGSLVLDINKFNFPVSGIASFKEIAKELDTPTKTIVRQLKVIEGDSDVLKHLEIPKGGKAWKVVRVREIGGRKVILDKDYFNKEIVSELTKEICEDSIYEYIEGILHINIGFAKKEITVETCTEEDKKYLDLEGYNMVVVVKSYTYLDDARILQYTESRHRPDRFKFVDFARRIKKSL